MRRPQDAAEPREELLEAFMARAQPGSALVAERLRRGTHLSLHVLEQPGSTLAATGEQGERLVEAATVGVGVEVAQAGREAAAHLSVGRGPRATAQHAPAM